ncbi:ubiquinol-cytochrome C chaperone family protein [Allosphingosinicella sp.]|uniref:ubiquinol-cytochrome C chaperone family protein n=1 Tax=Allosphingosinicella sp. TaxID=2823234 RepID=UPI002FC21B2E
MSFLSRIFGEKRNRDRLRPLYASLVAEARHPAWYREGQVPDTLDGRFDMVAAILALILLRLEHDGDEARDDSVLLTELFVDDMDGSVRQMGIGDLMVGKHVGRMVSALGGRLAAFRDAGGGAFDEPVVRNIFHESPPSDEAVRFVSARLGDFRDGLAAMPADRLLAGELRVP